MSSHIVVYLTETKHKQNNKTTSSRFFSKIVENSRIKVCNDKINDLNKKVKELEDYKFDNENIKNIYFIVCIDKV